MKPKRNNVKTKSIPKSKNDKFQSDEMKKAKSDSQKLYFQFAKFHASSHQCFIGNTIENGAQVEWCGLVGTC